MRHPLRRSCLGGCVTVDYLERPVALGRQVHNRLDREHGSVMLGERRAGLVAPKYVLAHLPGAEVQHQLRQVEPWRSKAERFEVREAYESVAVEVGVRRPQVSVAQSVSTGGFLRKPLGNLARRCHSPWQQLQPAQSRMTPFTFGTDLYPRKQSLVACFRVFGEPGEPR